MKKNLFKFPRKKLSERAKKLLGILFIGKSAVSLLALLFLWSSANALDTVYNTPVGSDISLGNSYSLQNDSNTSTQFCLDKGESSYLSSNIANKTDFFNVFSGGSWTTTGQITSNYYTSITCSTPLLGCMDEDSVNYDSSADTDDGSCLTCSQVNVANCSVSGCSTVSAQVVGGFCIPNTLGCTDPDAENYNANANVGNSQEFCLYCSPNSLENCSNESDCVSQGGQYVDAVCEGEYSPALVEGDISIKPPEQGSSYSFIQSTPLDYTEMFSQLCVSYNSSNICDGWEWSMNDDFFDFLISLIWKALLSALFVGISFVFLYKLFIYIKSFIF